MIKGITEINFPQYATLDSATITLSDMGDRTIQTQVRIDGDVAPDFSGWELEFRGERFILPIKEPQASKDNSSRCSLIDLTFYSWPIQEMKRYFFATTAQIGASTAIADQYVASVNMNITAFVGYFNSALQLYFGEKIKMELAERTGGYSDKVVLVEINKSYIWDVLQKLYELYDERWRIVRDGDEYTIEVGYDSSDIDIDDHEFEYGYDGGLIKFERQIQDDNINNILLGRGGENNLPYRYFKLGMDIEGNSPPAQGQEEWWKGDPDAIPELQNIYFDRLRDANFRWYVRGWMHNPNRDTSGDEDWDSGHVFPTYSDVPSQFQYAYDRGRTDEKFDPIEFVRDQASITKYGERYGALEDNDEIYPTIQGVTRNGVRIDEVLSVSPITSDDIQEAADENVHTTTIPGVENPIDIAIGTSGQTTATLYGGTFTIESGMVGNVSSPYDTILSSISGLLYKNMLGTSYVKTYDKSKGWDGYVKTDFEFKIYDTATGSEVDYQYGLQPGTYTYSIHFVISYNLTTIDTSPHYEMDKYGHLVEVYVLYDSIRYTVGLSGLKITQKPQGESGWSPTFDIWVRNIWNTTKGVSETEQEYSERVWGPILGDRVGNEAKIAFSDGMMSISEDYEFVIVSYPEYDNSVTGSEWRITLQKSEAEYETTGKFVPSADGGKPIAGDHFYFLGIDMPNQFVQYAEEDLTAFKGAELDKIKDINPTWVISLDKVRINTVESGDEGGTLASRFEAGAKLKIKDSRFASTAMTLYAQTITYTWSKGTIINPDVDIVLSDKVGTVESTVSRIEGDVEKIRATYMRIDDIDEAVRRVSGALFLKKNGESDKSYSPTIFANKVTGEDFREGDVGGRGWGIYKDFFGNTVIEADKLVARQELRVSTISANDVKYVGGKQINSVTSIEVSRVEEYESANVGYTRCYFDKNRGDKVNLFVVGDIIFSQRFNAENDEVKYYKAVLTAVGDNYIDFATESRDDAGVPEIGDTIIQYGHASNTDRQYAIIRDVIGGGYERMLSGLTVRNGAFTSGDEYYFAGIHNDNGTLSPRWFVGNHNGEFAEWYEGELRVKGKITVLGENDSEVLKPTSIIQDGLVLSSLIGVIDENDDLRAGLNASNTYDDATHGTLMMFAGSDSASASDIKNSDFRVYEDGTMFANKAILQNGCEIGNFRIESNILMSGTEGGQLEDKNIFKLYGSYINYEYETLQIQQGQSGYAKLSYLIGSPDYMSAVWKASKTEIECDTAGLQCYGAYYDIKGNNSGNYAIYAENGKYGGLRLDYDIIESDITLGQTKNVYYISGYYTITMPASPKEGQFYIFYIYNGATFIGNGKDFRTTDGRFLQNIGVSGGTHALVILTYTGVRWQACCVETQF